MVMMPNLSRLEDTSWNNNLKSKDKRQDIMASKYYVENKLTQKNSNEIRIEGTFIVKFDDDDKPEKYEIGKNINEKAPLIKTIMNLPKNSIFEINGEKGILVDKDLSVIE